MNSSILKVICVFGVIFLADSEAAFISFPRNEMALANERVELRCSTDSRKSLQWSVTYAQTTELIELFTYGNFTASGESKFRVDTKIPGQCNLIIDSVDLSYAGRYKCSEQPFGPEVKAELTVIDPQPLCRHNASDTLTENDGLWMQCILSYSGKTNLCMTWIRNNSGSVIQSISNLGNQSMTVIQVNLNDSGETFIFKATFTQENNSFQHVITWNYTVNVLRSKPGLVGLLVGITVVAVTVFCFIPLVGYICFRVYGKIISKRQETSAERQCQSDLNSELREEKSISKEHSQHRGATDQGLGNEGNYADLMNRSFNDQQYSRLHIYANSSVKEVQC